MRLLPAYLALVLSLASVAVAQTGRFVTPSGADFKTVYHPGQKVDLEWTGTAGYDILSLGYYAPNQNNTITWLISNSRSYPTSYTWVVRPGIDGFEAWETQSFALLVVNGTNFGQPFLSPVFYIRKKDESTPTTTPGSKPTAAVPSGANLPTTTNTAGEGNATVSDDGAREQQQQQQQQQQSGLSTGAKAGIGAGVGVGALLLLAAVAFVVVKRRRNAAPSPEGAKDGYQAPGMHEAPDGYYAPQDWKGYSSPPTEVPTTAAEGAPTRAELSGPGPRYEMA